MVGLQLLWAGLVMVFQMVAMVGALARFDRWPAMFCGLLGSVAVSMVVAAAGQLVMFQ